MAVLVISIILISLIGKSFDYHSIVYKITTIVCIIMAFFDFINYLPDDLKQILNLNVLIDFAKDIKLITDFVDELSLDNNLFRREV